MSLKCGIVGLPNVGKSTLFNSLTNSSQALAGNYPFCTIEANKGRVFVPDNRLKELARIIQPQQIIPTSFEFIDIAGLVKGASKGEGLGNQFLSHIREVDSLLHLVRIFKDKQISHVYGEPNPLRDIEIINTELLLADLEMAERRFNKIKKTAQSAKDKKLLQECETLKKVLDILSQNKSLRDFDWNKDEKTYLKSLNFISLKPVLYICNFKEEDFLQNQKESASLKTQQASLASMAQKIKDNLIKEELISISCALEAEMSGWTFLEKIEFLKPLGLKEPALHSVIKKVYQQLDLISFFTAGEKEVRAWTIPKGALAPEAGGKIHSDFEKGFIRAEVYPCEELFKQGSEKTLKQKGLVRAVGKTYEVQDGDVLHFLFNRP